MSLALSQKHRVIVVGGGAGGAELATALGSGRGRETMDVTLVDCVASHLWKPRLHEVAAGLIGAGEDELSYLALGQTNNFRFRMGALTGFDSVARTISISAIKNNDGAVLVGPREIAYDSLVLAFGSQVNDFGVEGVTEHCHMLDSGEQALAFKDRLFETAVQVSDGVLDRLRIGIVGAGATGVELAAELHRVITAMRRYGGLAAIDRLKITLIDMAPRVLANSDPSTSAFAQRALERLGVTVRLNASVERVTADGYILKGGDLIPCELKVWASGIIGRPLAARLEGLQVDRSRRIVCDEYLNCAGVGAVFALGDCASALDPETNRPLPATAQVAHQQAAYLARSLVDQRRDKALKPFRYRSMGSVISLGTESAVGEIPGSKSRLINLRGAIPKLLYLSLQFMHRAALIRWRRAIALAVADRLRMTSTPPVKLH